MSESNFRYRLSRALRWSARPLENSFIKHAVRSMVLPVMAALALKSAPTVAQEQARTQSVEIFGGELFGDKLTDTPVSG
jgi:hypothetical protein